MKKGFNVTLTCLYIIAVSVLVLTFSIALPIYCRVFYYAHINALGLPESTGYDYDTIRAAYDEVLNYLTLRGEFGTGVFAHTEEGAAHFADCKRLFDINVIALLSSFCVVFVLKILDRTKKIKLLKIKGFNPSFISAILLITVFVVIGIAVAADFNAAFVAFHHIFFPGKSNWTFDERYDQIIKILPAQFFLNCAILIFVSLAVFCGVIVFLAIKEKRKEQTSKNVSAKQS